MATSVALNTETFVGAPNGMGRYAPQHEISDGEAYSLFDVILNNAGFIPRRGPLSEVANVLSTSSRMIGLARTQDPNGVEQVAKLRRTTTPAGKFTGIVNSATLDASWPYTPSVSPYELFDSKDALLGGALVGTASNYSLSNPTNSALAFWHGASLPDVGATNLASSFVRGATTISLSSGGASFCAGHFIFNVSGQLVGTVKSVSGNTLTLRNPALVAGATSVTAKALRGAVPRVSAGRITTGTTSTQVNGGDTKFAAQGLATGTWDLYTPNYTWIGTVTSVVSDIQLNLVANAAVPLLNSEYIAIQTSADHTLLTATTLGWLNCSFAGHQFYARSNVVSFSDTVDREAVDLTNDGNTIIFSADPVRALVAGETAIVTLTEYEAYALTGAVGTTPDRWRGERIYDDGTICGMSAATFQGGVIWAGKRGIWYWNGSNPVNIASKLGDDYRKYVAGATRAYGMVVNNHYICFVEDGQSGIFSKTKGASTTNSARWTIVINLLSGTVSMFTNVEHRGAVHPPASLGLGTTAFGITTNEPGARVMNGDVLFTGTGNDPYTCENGPGAGPDLYIETKKYDAKDAQRLKLWKMFLMHYLTVGDQLNLDTVVGLNTAGTTAATAFTTSSTYTDKRIKFMKRSQFLALRIWQNSASVTNAVVGPWAIALKFKRPGRV
jgi:hypothetical protein